MNRNSKKTIQALAAGMAAVLTASPVLAAEENGVYKDETVYVNTTAKGAVTDVTVSDWLKNAGEAHGNLEDISDLKDIKNIKGDETFSREGNRLVWNTEGEDIYYQGSSEKELPVYMDIKYYLDGTELTPQELAGRSGHLKMVVSYTNRAKTVKKIDGKKTELYSPFVMISGMFLPTEKFTNVTIDNGKVVSDGNREIAAGIAMPGLKESLALSKDLEKEINIAEGFTLEADVTECEMGSMFTMAVTDIFESIDLGSMEDLDDLKDAMKELNDASLKLAEGAKELFDGTDTLDGKYQEFYEGIQNLCLGVSELGTGAFGIDTGASQLNGGASELGTGAEKLSGGISEYTAGADTLSSGIKQFTEGVDTLDGKMTEYVRGMKELTQGVGAYVSGGDALAGSLADYVNGASALTGGLTDYVNGVNTLADSVGSYVGGIQELLDGAGQIVPGISQEVAGIQQAASTLGAFVENTDAVKEQAGQAGESAAAALEDAAAQGQTISAALGTDAETMQAAAAQIEGWIASVPASEDGESNIDTSVLSDIAASLYSQASAAETAQGAGAQLGTDIAAASENLTSMKEALSGLSQDSGNLEGIDALVQGAAQLAGANQALQEGYGSLAQADTEKMIQGANALKESGSSICAGMEALQGKDNKNARALLQGAKELQGAKKPVTEGLSKMKEATAQLQKGAEALASNTGALGNGADQLSSKSGELTRGAKELAKGAVTLAEGAQELKTGTAALVQGTVQLSDGTKELAQGSDQLKDGIKELKNGALELKDGETEFHEEGIQKLNDTLNEKFRELLDRFEAVCSEEVQYTAFTDRTDNMDGNVKFIYETEPIEWKDEK